MATVNAILRMIKLKLRHSYELPWQQDGDYQRGYREALTELLEDLEEDV